jgi:hypothetical protein
MRLIGLLIAAVLVSLLFVWWISQYLDSTSRVMTTTQQLEENQGTQVQPGIGPIEYSKQKAKEINEMSEDRLREINQLP